MSFNLDAFLIFWAMVSIIALTTTFFVGGFIYLEDRYGAHVALPVALFTLLTGASLVVGFNL